MNVQSKFIDAVIIGAGASGLFLASKFLQLNKTIILLENSKKYGGQLNLYTNKYIYNIPLINKIKASSVLNKLYHNLKIQSSNNIDFLINSQIIDCKKNNEYFDIKIKNLNNNTFISVICKYIILAVGKGKEVPNKLPIKTAEQFENETLLYSVDNINIFKDKNVVIAGGGDSSIDWACEIAKISKKTTVIHRRDIVRPENSQFKTFKKLCEKQQIILKIPYNILELQGKNNKLSNLLLLNNNTKKQEILKCDYLLPFYGLKTIKNDLNLFQNLGIEINETGIKVDFKTNETNITNIFAIGDCCVFEGKIANIPCCFNDAMKSLYCICQREKEMINLYEHRK